MTPALSLETRIAQHPWKAIGGAFLLGAWAALEQPRLPHNRVARAAFAMFGAVALKTARELVLREIFAAARTWASEPSAAPS